MHPFYGKNQTSGVELYFVLINGSLFLDPGDQSTSIKVWHKEESVAIFFKSMFQAHQEWRVKSLHNLDFSLHLLEGRPREDALHDQ